jgi:transposase-like protein
MTYQPNYTLPKELMEQIALDGLEAVPEMIGIIINMAMKAERQRYLGLAPYERSPERADYANGYKAKTVTTRVGDITFAIPQVREGEFYPSALEKGLRSERALLVTVAEMYINGVSTRKVKRITEKLCGHQVCSSQVSRASAQLDEVLQDWRQRTLGKCRYLYLDALYTPVRQDGQVRDAAILLAVGVNEAGKRQILGVSVSLSEAEVHWRSFLQSLVQRGLRGVQLIISDAHFGLKAARQAVFGGVPWQRCQFHLQQNAQSYITRQEQQAEVAADIRAIFNARTRSEAETLLAETVAKYAQSASKLANWLETAIPQGLTVFAFPEQHRRRLRTANGLERLNREIRRRTRVVSIFPSEAACLRLVTAVLMEISDEWETGKVYLNLSLT